MLRKIFLLAFFINGFASQTLPTDIQKCKLDDSDCLVKIIQNIMTNYYNGKPEMGLVSLDPMRVDKMTISQGGDSPINIVLDFWNVSVSGLGGATITKATGFKATPDNNKLEFRMNAKLISIQGPYKGKGKVMIFPVQGLGMSNITLVEPKVSMRFLTKKIVRDGEVYMKIDKFKVDFDTSRLFMHYTGLFNGDKVLGDNLNSFLNDNWSDILNEMKPAINHTFGTVFRMVINKVFEKIPYKDFFTD